jgi:hypothetical protein
MFSMIFRQPIARVVRAEGNFALLRGVGDDAHFGAAEVIVEEVLEPHAGDEEEVPRIFRLAPLLGVLEGAVRVPSFRISSVVLASEPQDLSNFLPQVNQRQAGRRFNGL